MTGGGYEDQRGGGHENEDFLTRQLITYIGNKRALLEFIGEGIRIVQRELNKTKLSIFDVFSGSGVTARFFKQYADLLIVNDMEKYAELINRCYLSNQDELDIEELKEYHDEIMYHITRGPLRKGIIAELYAPKDEGDIQREDRMFYTIRNAMYIDTARQLIDWLPREARKYFIAPLLSEASIHANTSGVFKGFYKNKETGTGQFGGGKKDSLFRITGDITLPFPVFSNYNAEVLVRQGDANRVIYEVPEVDVAYLDPPYNQHPYGSNYFMLNVILDYQYPKNISKVSGIPADWNRSFYNKEGYALSMLTDLAANIRAKYVLISFNSEGFIPQNEMKDMLNRLGKVEILETKYNTFRGGRGTGRRALYVKEYLYLLKK
jgi:adenine-specific DNA-methyltransferase